MYGRSKRDDRRANRDADAWLRAVMGPLETQVKEHHLQLKRRLDSIRRIHSASDELEERVDEPKPAATSARVMLPCSTARCRYSATGAPSSPMPT